MRKTGIQKVLNELIGERREGAVDGRGLVMGESLQEDGGLITVDIHRVQVLSGLNILAESLIKSLVERSFIGPCDIYVEQPVLADLQPELQAAGIANISFYARLSVLEDLPRFREDLGYQIRYLFNAIQGHDVYTDLFPADGGAPRGVLFPFHREDGADTTGFFYLLEHVPAGHFLRITLEAEQDSRLRMTRIPHRVVNRIDLVHTRVDIPRAAEAVAQGIRETCGRQGWKYAASAAHLDDYYRYLRLAGLTSVESMDYSWPPSFARGVLSTPRAHLFSSVARILYVLGDSVLVAPLMEGRVVCLEDGPGRVYLDLSQKNRCLNLAFDAPRAKAGLPECLARMPAVRRTSLEQSEAFRGRRVLLIHHLTAEVLGFIQALADMGAGRIETLWVKYAGNVEPAFREIILSLPESLFRFHGVLPVPEPDGVQVRFVLSDENAQVGTHAPLAALLRQAPHGFFEAMRRVALHVFFRMAGEALAAGERLLVIEDGGYLAPALHRLCGEGRTVGEAAAETGFPEDALPAGAASRPLRDWLNGVLIGSVEHTRNGYDALKVEERGGGLAFPTLSIAVSDFKVNAESRDVAYSCLNAIENIMNGMGFVLADREALVLGAQGAIGRQTMRILDARLGASRLHGVDVTAPPAPPAWTFAADLDSLPGDVLARVDLIFGVVGKSICGPDWVERLLAATEKSHLFFASGSTKTMEFSQLSAWLSERATDPSPMLGDQPLTVALSELYDPKTGARQGRSARLAFGGKTVTLHLLADLMPVNFLYYGVPSETMNHVMNELLRLSALLSRRHRQGAPFPPALLALDHEIQLENIGNANHINRGEEIR